MQRNIF